jgi:hypothetical protein
MTAALALSLCLRTAAMHYRIAPELLRAIRTVEGGRIGAVHRNSNGTVDYGPFQVNSIWLTTLAPYGYTAERLTSDPCANVYAAAYILRRALDHAPNFWLGVGHYHSHSFTLARRYAWRVYRVYRR